MAFSEFELASAEKSMSTYLKKHRPPPEVRSQVDLGYRITNQSIEIFEIRSDWQEPTEKIENPVAKTTYVRKSRMWKIFWQRADLKWHRYDPDPEVDSLSEFLKIVEDDDYACFFG